MTTTHTRFRPGVIHGDEVTELLNYANEHNFALPAVNVIGNNTINGVLENGAVASVHFRGGYSRGTHFLWEITGTKGDLVISADGGHIQMLPLSLKGAQGSETELQSMPVPEKYNNIADTDLPDGPPASVARAYRHLMEDLNSGQQTLPGFDDAVVRHRLLEAIELSAKTGTRQSYKTTY